jgi:hypothetical protein
MQNGRALKERTGTDRSPRYARWNSQIRLCSPSGNLGHSHSQISSPHLKVRVEKTHAGYSRGRIGVRADNDRIALPGK